MEVKSYFIKYLIQIKRYNLVNAIIPGFGVLPMMPAFIGICFMDECTEADFYYNKVGLVTYALDIYQNVSNTTIP